MKKENTVVAAMQRGFTLVELLVVVAILGILATVAVSSVTGHIESTNITAAQTSVKAYDEAITTYQMKYGKYPTKVSDLVDGDDPVAKGDVNDPWDNPYQIKKSGKKYYVYSYGPDGQDGTEDDIRSDKIRKNKTKSED